MSYDGVPSGNGSAAGAGAGGAPSHPQSGYPPNTYTSGAAGGAQPPPPPHQAISSSPSYDSADGRALHPQPAHHAKTMAVASSLVSGQEPLRPSAAVTAHSHPSASTADAAASGQAVTQPPYLPVADPYGRALHPAAPGPHGPGRSRSFSSGSVAPAPTGRALYQTPSNDASLSSGGGFKGETAGDVAPVLLSSSSVTPDDDDEACVVRGCAAPRGVGGYRSMCIQHWMEDEKRKKNEGAGSKQQRRAEDVEAGKKFKAPPSTDAADASPSEDEKGFSCTCKKSKCLKLYCQCFANSVMCGPSCRCLICYNTNSNEKARKDAIRAILSRNPHAFDTKFGNRGKSGSSEHRVGCKCRKSACLKKYCECFHAGVHCSSNCRCVGCKNTPDASGSGLGDAGTGATASRGTAGAGSVPLAARSGTSNSSKSGKSLSFAADVAAAKAAVDRSIIVNAAASWQISTEDAAQHLAFLKTGNSPAKPTQTKSYTPASSSGMPLLASSEEIPNGDERFRTGVGHADVISPDTERKAGTVVSALLLAASALTELNSMPPAPSAVKSNVSKDVIESTHTPQRATKISTIRSPAVAKSPKRKSGSDELGIPTPKRQSSVNSTRDVVPSPDHAQPGRKNSRDKILLVDSGSDAGEGKDGNAKDQVEAGTAGTSKEHHHPFTPPIPPKLKKKRMGSVNKSNRKDKSWNPFPTINEGSNSIGRQGEGKAGNENQTRLRRLAELSAIDSTARPTDMEVDSDAEDAASTNSSGHNGGDSDEVEMSNESEGKKTSAAFSATPAARENGNILTPVSSRIVGLRKLDVNDDVNVRGDIGIELEGQVNAS